MSLTKEAIQHIEANAIAAGKALPPLDFPLAALPADIKLHSLEKYIPHRMRFRGTMATTSIKDFSAYVHQHDNQAAPAAAFVDADSMLCRVIFNLGTPEQPGHGDDVAQLTLKASAIYKAVQGIAGTGLSQRELAEWLEDWAQYLKIMDGDNSLSLAQAVAAVRNITIKASSERAHSEHNFGAARSAMDEIEAKSQERLPTYVLVNLVPYEGLGTHLIRLRLSVITGDKPQLKLRWVREEAQREEIAQDFKDVLEREIGGTARLVIGAFELAA